MNSVSARSLLWTALAGLVLGILGSGWDRIWHSRHPEGELASASKLLEAHWLIFVGILVIFTALLSATRGRNFLLHAFIQIVNEGMSTALVTLNQSWP
jgi:multisubunit Na+/H+ antiporter MnhB subunit